VKVGELRTGWGSLSLQPTTRSRLYRCRLHPGARWAIPQTVSLTSLPLAPSSIGRMPKARIKGKLPIEIVVVKADQRHHRSVRKPRTHAYRRASEAPVSARAVAVIRPAPIIHRSPPVPLHPVWQTPVARFSVPNPLWQPFGLTDRRPSSTQLGLGARSEQLNGI